MGMDGVCMNKLCCAQLLYLIVTLIVSLRPFAVAAVSCNLCSTAIICNPLYNQVRVCRTTYSHSAITKVWWAEWL